MAFNSLPGVPSNPLYTNLFLQSPLPLPANRFYPAPRLGQHPYQGQTRQQSIGLTAYPIITSVKERPEWTPKEIRVLLGAAKGKSNIDWSMVRKRLPNRTKDEASDKLNELHRSGISTVKKYLQRERNTESLQKAITSYAKESMIEHKASNFSKKELVDQNQSEFDQYKSEYQYDLLESIACFLIE